MSSLTPEQEAELERLDTARDYWQRRLDEHEVSAQREYDKLYDELFEANEKANAYYWSVVRADA